MANHSDDSIINITTGDWIDSNGNVVKDLLSISKSLVQAQERETERFLVLLLT